MLANLRKLNDIRCLSAHPHGDGESDSQTPHSFFIIGRNPRRLYSVSVQLYTTEVLSYAVRSGELKRWLERHGCTFTPGKGGHLLVRLGSKKTVLPMHGKSHDLPTGTVNGIKKALGLK